MPRVVEEADHGPARSDTTRAWGNAGRTVPLPPCQPPSAPGHRPLSTPGVRFYPRPAGARILNNGSDPPAKTGLQWQSVVEYTEKGGGGLKVLPQVTQVETILLQGRSELLVSFYVKVRVIFDNKTTCHRM